MNNPKLNADTPPAHEARTVEEMAENAAKKFNWAGVINKLRTMSMAYKLGFKAGHASRDAEVAELKSRLDKESNTVLFHFKKERELESKLTALKSAAQKLEGEVDTFIWCVHRPEHTNVDQALRDMEQALAAYREAKKGVEK